MAKQSLSIVLANPAGNMTIFVLTPVSPCDYGTAANQLLQMKELGAEQVAFVKSFTPNADIKGTMEMSGLEFCGNASRSFALLAAKTQGLQGKHQIKVAVSGTPNPLTVSVDTIAGRAEIIMPNPDSIEILENQKLAVLNGCMLIAFEGISHVILNDVPASPGLFEEIKDIIMAEKNPAALGVMFYDTQTQHMTPVVYVRDVNSTYFEGSCGSGTTALSVALSAEYAQGLHTYTVVQPAGTLTVTVQKEQGLVGSLALDGDVALNPAQSVMVDL